MGTSLSKRERSQIFMIHDLKAIVATYEADKKFQQDDIVFFLLSNPLSQSSDCRLNPNNPTSLLPLNSLNDLYTMDWDTLDVMLSNLYRQEIELRTIGGKCRYIMSWGPTSLRDAPKSYFGKSGENVRAMSVLMKKQEASELRLMMPLMMNLKKILG
ncbi:hypothetical protein Tco_1208387 [Tanacetum coccineum]